TEEHCDPNLAHTGSVTAGKPGFPGVAPLPPGLNMLVGPVGARYSGTVRCLARDQPLRLVQPLSPFYRAESRFFTPATQPGRPDPLAQVAFRQGKPRCRTIPFFLREQSGPLVNSSLWVTDEQTWRACGSSTVQRRRGPLLSRGGAVAHL